VPRLWKFDSWCLGEDLALTAEVAENAERKKEGKKLL
jgi:hypothetical protein